MATQTIKDSKFRVIGYIDTRSDGTQVAKDDRFQILGHFDPRFNTTKDAHFRVIGYGNLLASLIH